jgi:hypothetical protein
MQELEREYEKIAKAVAEGREQMLRIEGAILILRELVEKEAQAEKEQVPQG